MDQLHPPNIVPIIDPDKIEHTEADPDGEPDNATVLNVHAYDWTIKDMYGDDDHVSIHCWALDRFSKPYLLRFNDFPVFCQIELPMFVRNRVYQWRPAAVDAFMNLLSQRLGNDAPIRYVFRQAKKTYYYRGNRNFPMVQVSFNNLKAMQHCSNLLNDPIKTDDWGFIKCSVWEDSISIVRKLLTVRDVRYSQWFSVVGHKVDPELRISTIENEYIAEWDTMEVIPQAQCSTWSTQPGVLAFDIECYSNNHRAMPDKYNAAHVAYMISCVFQRYRRPDTRRRYGIIIGDCHHIPPEKLENCTVIKVNTEYEMIVAFGRVVRETDPEILAGYNILSFDYPYLDHRVKRWLKQWPSMSRIDGEIPNMTSKTWQSGAYGHQSINILHLEGRISIDLLPIVKRDYKLEKYDLNTVCKKFVGKGKHDISAPEMFLIYEDMRNTLTTLVEIMKEAQDNPAIKESLEYAVRRRDAQKAFEDAKTETTRVLEYCIQDAELVIELMEKLHVWVGLVEMSNIVGVTITDLFTRGQQVRCLSQIYDKAARLGFVLDKRDVPGFKFTGGFVYEPIPGLYDNIICLDFASLYPSIMMAYNICYTTLVPPELEDLIPDEDCHVIEFDQDEIEGDHDEDEEDEEILKEINDKGKKGGKTVKRHYRFKFYKKQEGLLPQLVRQMVAERRAVNRRIVQIKDELKILERTETVRTALVNYLNGTIQVQDVKAAAQRVKELSESNPPAKPEIITAAKRELAVAQLFNVAWTQKRLEDTPKTNQTQLTLAQLELEIAQLYEANDRDRLNVKLAHLQLSQEVRCLRIEDIKVEVVVLDKRQLALKTTANSFFGFLGVHTGGKMPLIEGAMSITAKGRELIGLVRRYIEQSYQGVQIYGDTDCVRGHTPVLIRYETGAIDFVQIKDLTKLNPEATGKQEFYNLIPRNIEVWTEKGWSKIKYLMRRKTLKKLYRVVTHTGIVDVSEDHSLLNEKAEEVTPNQIAVGMKLLHQDLPNVQYVDPNMNESKAWAWGFFMAEGTCGSYDCPTGKKSSWSVANQNHAFLTKAQEAMRAAEPGYDFIIDPCMESSNVDKLNARGNDIVGLVAKYDKLFYTERSETVRQNIATDLGIRYKKVPYEILIASNNIKTAFLQGWYDGDGAKTEGNSRRFDIKGQIGAAGLFYICSALGYNVSINTRTDKEDIYRLTFTTSGQRKPKDQIKKIIFLGRSLEDVFDVETENHHFGAGIGRMIVHNSVMMKLPQVKNAKDCNYWGMRLSQEISGIKPGEKDCDDVVWPDGRPGLFPPPLAMEFEKAMRLLCLKKKKYAAYLVCKDGTFKTEDIMDRDGNVIGSRLMMLKKGIVLARRDNCGYLRKTYTRILELIMNKGSLDEAVNVLVDSIQELLDGKVPYQDLVVIRELGANYKSDSFFMKVFSDDLKKAGKIVNPGDRLDFVIVEDPTATLLGHKMRLTEQYLERLNSPNPERIDYNYYIEKALMNPINQLFEVGFKDDIAKLQHVSYKPTNRHKAIYLDRPVQIILKMRERGYDLKVFREAVRYNVMRLRGLNPVILNVTRPEAVTAAVTTTETVTAIGETATPNPIPTIKPMIQLVVQQPRTNPPTLPNLPTLPPDKPNLPTLPPDKPIIPQIPQVLQTVQPRPVILNLQASVAGKVPLTPALIMPKMALKTPRSSTDSTNSTPNTSPNSPLNTPVNTPPPTPTLIPTLNRQVTLNIGGRIPTIPTVPMLPASMLTLRS